MSVTATERVRGAHLVRFYRSDRALARLVAGHLRQALDAGGVAVMVATWGHRQVFDTELQWSGVDTGAARERGDLIVLDAARALAGFRLERTMDQAAFHTVIGSVLRAAARRGGPVHVYGEMVAVLWERGEVAEAMELEDYWNQLGRELTFDLLCAYRANPLDGDGEWTAAARQRVRDLHTGELSAHLHPPGDDVAGAAATFTASAQAAGKARGFVMDTVRSWHGDDQLVADAGLVASELATNAVLHADTEFTVQVSWAGGGLRVAVVDASPTRPTTRVAGHDVPSGRGMAIVEAVSDRWTAEAHGTGKVVWAELDPW